MGVEILTYKDVTARHVLMSDTIVMEVAKSFCSSEASFNRLSPREETVATAVGKLFKISSGGKLVYKHHFVLVGAIANQSDQVLVPYFGQGIEFSLKLSPSLI